MAFRWRGDDGPTLNAGLVALCFSGDPDQYCYETQYFCDFSGWGGESGPPVPPLDPPMLHITELITGVGKHMVQIVLRDAPDQQKTEN